jgi:hypothetical protein
VLQVLLAVVAEPHGLPHQPLVHLEGADQAVQIMLAQLVQLV